MFDKKCLQDIRSAMDKWESGNRQEFAKEAKQFATESGIPVGRIYTPLDLAEKGFDYLKDLGFPGSYPFTRSISPVGYRDGVWNSSQYSGRPTPEETNTLWKTQLAAGQSRVYVAYDLPSQLGYDPGHSMAEGEVGRVGISMCSLRDWEVAFDGIDIRKTVVSQVNNAMAITAVACHLALAEKRGIPFSELSGSCQNDILKEYTSRGNYVFPPAPGMRLAIDTVAYCGEHLPNYMPMTVSFNHPAQVGAHPVHHIAFALANAFAYYQYSTDRGLDIDTLAPGIMFLGGIGHHDFFEEIAKYRAMRKIYARVLKERFNAKKPSSMAAKFLGGACGTDMYREQYLNNIARGAITALVGILAGVQICDLRAYDEQYGIPTNAAIITALRTQQVAFYESGAADTVDPLGGSYFVESLTLELEERINKELERIERQGGVLAGIESGYFRRVMAEDAMALHKRFERGDITRVGVNRFQNNDEDQPPTTVYRADPKLEGHRVAAVNELKRNRDNEKVTKALAAVKAMAIAEATANNNMMPVMLDAVKAYATYGEICDVLREVWGEYKEPSFL
ncbi:putative Methylmalonyl-CoA mutase [Georgfuchsia toluolica]|uniref:Methylmalonyl-CoA mutase n=1 Tax=Georgfuchsia toluolica TaxID=424218 RepID=A0A916J6Z1_9PROT|nr:methylmalonyl-CoA mutase family protein [Georgfuchsia toluolica]CAG4885123.1 putative Methylmalonyl-CoA mutase [Georgfuchsia toluolica]